MSDFLKCGQCFYCGAPVLWVCHEEPDRMICNPCLRDWLIAKV
jgi:hypothetical protein